MAPLPPGSVMRSSLGFSSAKVVEVVEGDVGGGVGGFGAPVGGAVGVPPVGDFRRVTLEIFAERLVVELLDVFFVIDRASIFLRNCLKASRMFCG